MPEQACLLVSHPLMYHASFNFFYQTVVLLGRHSLASGTYGVVLNKLLSTEAKEMMARVMGSHPSQTLGQPQANLDLARDLPVVLQALMGEHAGHTNN